MRLSYQEMCRKQVYQTIAPVSPASWRTKFASEAAVLARWTTQYATEACLQSEKGQGSQGCRFKAFSYLGTNPVEHDDDLVLNELLVEQPQYG